MKKTFLLMLAALAVMPFAAQVNASVQDIATDDVAWWGGRGYGRGWGWGGGWGGGYGYSGFGYGNYYPYSYGGYGGCSSCGSCDSCY